MKALAVKQKKEDKKAEQFLDSPIQKTYIVILGTIFEIEYQYMVILGIILNMNSPIQKPLISKWSFHYD